MSTFKEKESYDFQDLRDIMHLLRQECPWDKKQTHESLQEPLLEESYELLHAIKNKDVENMKEELGDVLLQVLFHSELGEESGNFAMDEIMTGLANKLIYRHPHIFGDKNVKNSEEVKEQWDALKMKEKKQQNYTQTLTDVPDSLPALVRAMKVQKKASKVGFDHENKQQVLDKLEEELSEFKEECLKGDLSDIEEEFGDLLFSMVNLSRFFKINAEFALTNAIEKFINRFRYIEIFAIQAGRTLDNLTLEEMNTLWDQAKSCTKKL